MAAGKVITGFSKPYVAVYSASGGTVTYSKGMELARGVGVSTDYEVGDSNPFYANNVEAENVPGVFTGGTATLTVDGLFAEAEELIFGLPEPESFEYGADKTVQVRNYGEAAVCWNRFYYPVHVGRRDYICPLCFNKEPVPNERKRGEHSGGIY